MEIDAKNLKQIQKKMNDTISDLLYGGSSDPGYSELSGAAACYFVLQTLGLKVKNTKDVKTELSGENIHDFDFINNKDVGE